MPDLNYSTIFTLGPAGTFSDEAAQKICTSATTIVYTQTFAKALIMLSKEPNAGAVVPIENSVAGTIAQVQEMLVSEALNIVAEIQLPVRYALLVKDPLQEIVTHYAHPQAFEQTSKFTAQHFPQSNVEFSNSNVDSSVRFLAAIRDNKPAAAIVPLSFAEKYPQYLHSKNIQDYKSNTTRFLVVQKKQLQEVFDWTQQKTSLFIEFKDDRSGLLYDLLSIFNRFQINLCRLESRPAKDTPWFYVFYVDFTNNENSQECLEVLKHSPFECQVLGSYSEV